MATIIQIDKKEILLVSDFCLFPCLSINQNTVYNMIMHFYECIIWELKIVKKKKEANIHYG